MVGVGSMTTKKKTVKKKKEKEVFVGEIINPGTITPLDGLKISERIFCQEYVQNFGNAVQAYQKAYPKARYNTARSQASIFLAKPNILGGINFILSKLWKLKDEEFSKSKVFLLIQSFVF